MTLFFEQGGRGADLLVLLHGLGATGAVWQPFLASADQQWPGRWLAIDLPGHGASPAQTTYEITDIAVGIARAVTPHADPAGRLVVLGHSLGGAIGLVLASGAFGVQPERVFGVGIKVAWSDDDLQRLAAIAAQPRRQFATELEARERYLKVAGLAGQVDARSPVLARGVVRQGSDGGRDGTASQAAADERESWCLAMDPRANAVGRPPFAPLRAAARCPIHLARGREDPLVTLDQWRSLDPRALDLAARSHNAMVEAPGVLWEWLAATRR